MDIGLITPPITKIALKKIPQTFGRDVQRQKSLNMFYFNKKLSKQLPRKMGHGPKECHPTIYLYFNIRMNNYLTITMAVTQL